MVKLFKCNHCGKIVAVFKECKSDCPTICCGEPMVELKPNTVEAAFEKHIPVYEVVDNVVKVTVGSIEHPMTEEHLIESIIVSTNKGNQRKSLKPGDRPYAEFALLPGEKVETVLAYCNLHGLWAK